MLHQTLGQECSAAPVTPFQCVFVVLFKRFVIVCFPSSIAGSGDHVVEILGLLRQFSAFMFRFLFLLIQELYLALLYMNVDTFFEVLSPADVAHDSLRSTLLLLALVGCEGVSVGAVLGVAGLHVRTY